jgi:riboflavin kinase/FMN adenylyltransferase
MKVIQNLNEIPAIEKIGLTVGNFDGVHLGHHELLKIIKGACQEKGLKLVVMTFVPHPLAVLRPNSLQLINSYEERRSLLEELNVDYLYEVEFTRDLSLLTPESFLENYLLSHEGTSALYLGYDFAFGANKEGDYEFAQNYCKGRGVVVENCAELKVVDQKVSSTKIREALNNGDVKKAKLLLGREFFVRARVTKGAGRGAQIGFPTANLENLENRVILQKGVYVTQTRVRGEIFSSVTNVGVNPTFNSDKEIVRIETYILDFSCDIYGEEIEILFHSRLRDEKKFSSVEELRLQIAFDVKCSYQYFSDD